MDARPEALAGLPNPGSAPMTREHMAAARAHTLSARTRMFVILLALLAFWVFACDDDASAEQAVGVQTHLMWGGVDNADVERQLDKVAESGAGVIRLDVGWASLQPDGPGQWSDWALNRLDNIIAEANERDIRVLVTFWQSPCWASSAPAKKKQGCEGAWWDRQVQLYAPRYVTDYASALAVLVQRYGDQVDAWEIWSEPNGRASYRARHTVRSYVRLTKSAYTAAKATDPNTTIVAGALMWADRGFTRRLYRKGIEGYFDALSIHPYSDARSPLDASGEGKYVRGSFARGVPAVRDLMQRRGDDKPLWLTEFGWSTTSVRDSAGWLNGVNEDTQARYVTQALEKIQEWDYVDVAIYFKLEDTSADERDTVANFGLLEDDGSEKRAFEAFKEAAQPFAG